MDPEARSKRRGRLRLPGIWPHFRSNRCPRNSDLFVLLRSTLYVPDTFYSIGRFFDNLRSCGRVRGPSLSVLNRKERDNETALDYFSARFYASLQGRFTSADPLIASGRASMPQSWNRYAYVLNNPLNLIDPSGLGDDDPQDAKKKKDPQPKRMNLHCPR